MSRDWIITVLKGLPVWLWPIFLWDAARVGAWWQGLPIRADALLSVGVTKGGRIVVIGVTEGDGPDPCDWTLYTPRAPWARLSPEGETAPEGRGEKVAWKYTVAGPEIDPYRPVSGLVFLDPG